jgi:uncharacterized protein YbjQ (UPF0145 family)
MKKLLSLVVVAIVAIMFTSCGVSSYMTSNVNVNQTNVVLQENNYNIVKHVYADVSQSYFCGIGGLGKRALKENAVAELTEKAQLSGSQALINVTIKEDIQNILIWSKRTVRAHGTVVEFVD